MNKCEFPINELDISSISSAAQNGSYGIVICVYKSVAKKLNKLKKCCSVDGGGIK